MSVAGFRVTPLRVMIGTAILLGLTALILYRIPSSEYVLIPDPAHPLTGLVRVKGQHPAQTSGTIYYVDVFERQANELEWLFPSLDPHSTFLPASEVVPPGSTSQAEVAAAFREMSMSQKIAAAVAERQLGLPVVTHPDGVLVDNVYSNVPAAANVHPADVIVGADGKATPTPATLRKAIDPVKPGQFVRLKIRRGNRTLTERVKTIADPNNPQRAFVGVLIEQAASITLPKPVSFDLSRVGGPSAGLAFALEIMEKLGRNVTHGHKVAATGEMQLDGTVAPIGGVKQKTWGVRAAGADVFLVPAGGNAETAKHFAGPVTVIPVHSLAQALHALATLPPKS